ncbi:hypothetical protein BD289DRAFT_445678, partial [Coniella lustricola]
MGVPWSRAWPLLPLPPSYASASSRLVSPHTQAGTFSHGYDFNNTRENNGTRLTHPCERLICTITHYLPFSVTYSPNVRARKHSSFPFRNLKKAPISPRV